MTLRETLARHFNSVLLSIERGLPEVAQEKDDDLDYEYKLAKT